MIFPTNGLHTSLNNSHVNLKMSAMSQDFINLSGGDPDVEAPSWVIEAAIKSIKKGGPGTHYSHSTSIPQEFQKAVVNYYATIGPRYEPNDVLPTAGGSAALYIALASTLKQGDEALLWNPVYAGHPWILDEMGVKMNLAPLIPETNYHPDLDTLEQYVTGNTKAIILCNPSNPTGTVFTEKELKAIGDIAIDNGLTIISDEIYLHYVYPPSKFIAPSNLPGLKEQTINVMSFSKTFSMTGWRLGYAIIPETYMKKARAVARMIAARPATFTLEAGTTALTGDLSYIKNRRTEYQKRRDYFIKAVNQIEGLNAHLYEGAFYAWINAKSTELGSYNLVNRLKEKENVELSPGGMFGDDTFIRVPLTQPIPILKDVIERVKKFMKSL